MLLLRDAVVKHPLSKKKRHRATKKWTSPLLEIARVLVRLDHVSGVIVNAIHSIM